MSSVKDSELEVARSEEEVWNDDSEPDFTALREAMGEEEAEPEQPEVDEPEESDIEAEDEVDEDEVDTEQESEELTDETDEVPTEDTEEESNEEEATASQSYKVKANGTEFDFTIEELQKLAPKAMDYTKKMQEIAPWRKTISALTDEGLDEADVNLMIDMLKGDKDAIAAVLKRTGIDALDLDTDDDKPYQPKQYGRNDTELAIDDIVREISADPEYKITQHVVDSQWDSKSRQALADNPQGIKAIHEEIKNGNFDKVSPMAMKLKVLDGASKSDLEYYLEAEKTYFSQKDVQDKVDGVNTRKEKEADRQQAAKKRKAAAPTKSKAGKRNVVDYLDDNDEAYDDWYKNLQEKN